jgi:hypothetical protein
LEIKHEEGRKQVDNVSAQFIANKVVTPWGTENCQTARHFLVAITWDYSFKNVGILVHNILIFILDINII